MVIRSQRNNLLIPIAKAQHIRGANQLVGIEGVTAHANIFADIVQNAGAAQQQTLVFTHAVILGHCFKNGHSQTLHLLHMVLVV